MCGFPDPDSRVFDGLGMSKDFQPAVSQQRLVDNIAIAFLTAFGVQIQ